MRTCVCGRLVPDGDGIVTSCSGCAAESFVGPRRPDAAGVEEGFMLDQLEAALVLVERLRALPWARQPAVTTTPNRDELDVELATLRGYLEAARVAVTPASDLPSSVFELRGARGYTFAHDQVRGALVNLRAAVAPGVFAPTVPSLMQRMQVAIAYLVDADAALDDAITETPESHGARRKR